MQFASVAYMLFIALSVAVYFSLPGRRSRTTWLLAASYLFYYSLSASWTLLLLVVTLAGYVFGRLLDRAGPAGPDRVMPPRTKTILRSGIASIAGVLFVFKYVDFVSGAINDTLALLGSSTAVPLLRLALPIGISFWTFQTIAYLVDVARGSLPAERDIFRYALSIGFFAHVTAGPIARGGRILPQLAEVRRYSFQGMRSGLLLMLWGFFKKLLVADPMSVFVAAVFADPRAHADSGLVLAAAAVGFAIQIYCDFSGYTDIARGTARLFGVELARNFDRPYAARSIREFWRRWHMTLMSWLKDYVYIPLGGNRVSPARRRFNIMAVFALSGLWHGAGATFLLWGLLNGIYQIAGELLAPIRAWALGAVGLRPGGRIHRGLQTASTFVLITIAWVFFRAESVADALYIVPRMFVPTAAFLGRLGSFEIGLSYAEVVRTALAVAVVFAVDFLSKRIHLPRLVFRLPLPVRWVFYEVALLLVVVLGHYGPGYKAADFVYFKF